MFPRDDSYLVKTRLLDGGRRINEVFYPAGVRQELHQHTLASFSFVACGRYGECIGRQNHSRLASTLVYHPAGEKHAVAFETDVRILSVEFRSPRTESLESSSQHRSDLVAWLGARLEREITRSDSASSLAIDGIIDEMLIEGSRGRVLTEERRDARWLVKATEYVHDNFSEAFTLDEIAQVAGVHSAHLSRVFRQKMGCTVGEYVRRLRFEFASNQLLSTERPLSEVAHDAGFSDQSHFHRLFRTRMGVTPHTYRKLHKHR
ncbi:MAG TPA: AraC family transcriptional regulator [Pyrinomonadaceae bacterium]|nr:AraC family transcriptional regulator [Pyrinomonadaceae bacterium]